MYVTEEDSEYGGYGYSDSCKTCSFFDVKVLDKTDDAICYKKVFKETMYFCKKGNYYITESGKLPSIVQCVFYKEDKFLSVMREIIRKDEEGKKKNEIKC
jgi:hypothetical protein